MNFFLRRRALYHFHRCDIPLFQPFNADTVNLIKLNKIISQLFDGKRKHFNGIFNEYQIILNLTFPYIKVIKAVISDGFRFVKHAYVHYEVWAKEGFIITFVFSYLIRV